MADATTSKRQDARALRSRASMQAALLALLAEHPLSTITAAMVSDAAGIGYSTFFRHYADVPALLVDAVSDLARDLAQTMLPPLLHGDARAAALHLIEAIARRRAEVSALLAGAGETLRGTLARAIVARLADLPDLSPDWLPQRLALRVAVATTIELCEWWLLEAPDTRSAIVADMLEKLVLAPLTLRGIADPG